MVEFLPPIPPGLPMREFMARMEAVVEERSDALAREAGFAPPEPIDAEGVEAPARQVSSGDR